MTPKGEGLAAEITSREKIAYGCGDLSSNLMWGLTSSYLMFYYTDIYGIAPQAVAWILLLARIFDAFCDPAIGWFVDRAGGKVIPRLIRTLALPYGITGILCFLPLPLSPEGKIVWAALSYIVFGAVYSCINTPYGALSTMIARAVPDRVDLNAYRLMGCQLGQFCVASLTIPVITLLGGGGSVAQRQVGMAIFVLLLGIVGSGLWWLVARVCVVRYPSGPARHDMRLILRGLGRNLPWWLCNALVFCQFVGIATLYGFVLYYVRAVLHGDDQLGGTVLTVATVMGFVGAVLCPMATRRAGVLRVALLATGMQVVTFALLYGLPSLSLPLFFALLVPVALAQGIMSPLFYVLLAATIDERERHGEGGTAGIAYSINTLVSKLSMGVTGFILAQFLAFGHYDAAASIIPPTTTAWIVAGFVLLPLLGNLLQFGLLLVMLNLRNASVRSLT
ncbi:MAG: glycoside-pentoside-hexuronide (GPH):cation symporter [Gluconacetobacter liquefaciens]